MPTFLSAQNFGGGKAASGGSGGDSTPQVTRFSAWWEESVKLSSSEQSGRQWSLGNGAIMVPLYLHHEWTVEAVTLTLIVRDDTTSIPITVAPDDVVVALEYVDPAQTTNLGGTDVDDDLDITILNAPETAYGYMVSETVEPASEIVLPAGSYIRPYTKSGVNGTGTSLIANVYQIFLKRNES